MGNTLFICTDGTWNTPDQKDDGVIYPGNVARMARIILSIPEQQITWYDAEPTDFSLRLCGFTRVFRLSPQ
ncbi:MAG: hypothetical protein ACLFQT_12035 [Thiohalophilus sp.]